MKNPTALQQLSSSCFAVTLLTALTLIAPIQSAYAETTTQKQICQESRRGTRCKISPAQEMTTASVNSNTDMAFAVCSKSARGTRCHNRMEGLVITRDMKTPPLNNKYECRTTVRGTRACNI